MPISILESIAQPLVSANKTGTINALAIGDVAVVGVGTSFDTEYAAGDLISFLDTAGARRIYTVLSVTDATNLTLVQGVSTASSAGITHNISTMQSPYVIGGDAKALNPNQLPIYSTAFGFVLNAVQVSALNYFDVNEGVKIESFYLRLPYQYTLSARNTAVILYQANVALTSITLVKSIGVGGSLPVPIENSEIPLESYIPNYAPPGPVASVNWGLRGGIYGCPDTQIGGGANFSSIDEQPTISDVSAPDSLTGELMPLIIGVRVKYAIDLQAS